MRQGADANAIVKGVQEEEDNIVEKDNAIVTYVYSTILKREKKKTEHLCFMSC